MKPIEFEGQNCVFAKDQPEYLPLPARIQLDGNEIVSCWELSDEEIEEIRKNKRIYVDVLTFGHKLQPMMLSPYRDEAVLEED